MDGTDYEKVQRMDGTPSFNRFVYVPKVKTVVRLNHLFHLHGAVCLY